MLAPGFTDPVAGSQQVFRAVLQALSRPARPWPLAPDLTPPPPLRPELAAVALALADHDAPLWLAPTLSGAGAVREYLVFHTGAKIASDPADAAFALVSNPGEMPALDAFALGSDAYPDRSTTVVLGVDSLTEAPGLDLEGPGILGRARLSADPLPTGFATMLAANRRLFPRGIDILLVAPGLIAGLPRSTSLVAEEV